MILVIDNYDSFTWNIVHRLCEARPGLDIGRGIRVVRNDDLDERDIEVLHDGSPPSGIVLSPGPCSPGEAGVCVALVQRLAGRTPILGICLGHQCIASAFGMAVVRHEPVVHGKRREIHHDGLGVLDGLESPIACARYHSLAVDAGTVTKGWAVSAWLDEPAMPGQQPRRVVMGLRAGGRALIPGVSGSALASIHRPMHAPVEGVQFHPESFLTASGVRMLGTFLSICDAYGDAGTPGRAVPPDPEIAPPLRGYA